MDKRLELTKEQQAIIERYNAIIKEMEDANIHCIYRPYSEIVAINGNSIEDDLLFPEDTLEDEGDTYVDFDEPTAISCPFGLSLTCEDSRFGVTFKKD